MIQTPLVRIVSASRHDAEAFAADTLLGRSLSQRAHHDCQRLIRYRNDQPLALAYNAAIEQANPDDLLVFCHDDVWLGEPPLAPQLVEALAEFDLVGVAGNSRLMPGQSSWCWKTDGSWDTRHLVGQIRHGDPRDSHPSFYGPTPAAACLLDGVFLGRPCRWSAPGRLAPAPDPRQRRQRGHAELG
jgi:hypothetical protein